MLIKKETLIENNQGGCKVTCIVTGEQWKQNTYIVSELTTSNSIIIDPGDNAEHIIKCVQNEGRIVTHILLTHPHHDHIGAAAQVSEYFNVVCELHKHDVRLLMHAPMYALRFANITMAPVTQFQPFDELCLSAEVPALRAIHTPGHTKGSVCYLFNGFIMTGDTLLYKHIGRTDLPGSSKNDILSSIQKLLNELPDEIAIFSGHGKPWTVGEAKEWWAEMQSAPTEHKNFIDKLS